MYPININYFISKKYGRTINKNNKHIESASMYTSNYGAMIPFIFSKKFIKANPVVENYHQLYEELIPELLRCRNFNNRKIDRFCFGAWLLMSGICCRQVLDCLAFISCFVGIAKPTGCKWVLKFLAFAISAIRYFYRIKQNFAYLGNCNSYQLSLTASTSQVKFRSQLKEICKTLYS